MTHAGAGPHGDGDAGGETGPLDAGEFGAWLAAVHAAIAGEGESTVPCGDCTGCCTSSQFVHIAPDERATLARIPAALRFPAPGLPKGHVLLGYDEHGRCPMLRDGACTIYDARPRTCRTYDCRVFTAAGVEPDAGRPAIRARVTRWRFSYRDAIARVRHDAVRAAAAAVEADVPPTGRAVIAVQLADAFTGPGAAADEVMVIEPDPDVVRLLRARIADRTSR